MLYLESLAFTLPAMLAGLLGIFLVMGVLIAAVVLLGYFTGGKG